MKKLDLLKCFAILVLMTGLVMSCQKDETNPIGFEVSGSSFDGNYLLDKAYTKGPKYVHASNENYVLKTYTDDGTEMWCLIVNNNTIYYKTPKTGTYPPESGWTCGIGADKPKFKVTPIYE